MNFPRRVQFFRLLGDIALPVLLLLACDRGFGWYAARAPNLPVAQLFFGDPLTSAKFIALRQRPLPAPALDVLLMGMSQVMRINGAQLEAELSERTQRAVRTFNFAGPYHSFAFDRVLLRDIVVPIAKPAVVVYGVTPMALLNEKIPARTVEAQAQTMPVFGLYTGSPVERLRGFAMLHLNLWRYRQAIRSVFDSPLGWKVTTWDAQARAATAAGDVPLLTQHIEVTGLNRWGLEHQRRFARFDAVMHATLLFDHLVQFAQFCRQRGIELVLLNNPVHPVFMETLPHGQQDYDHYLARLRAVAAENGVRLFEPVPSGVGSPELYQDMVHHDAAGGAWLTEELARYLIDNRLVTAQ